MTDEPPVLDPALPRGAPPPHKLMCIVADGRADAPRRPCARCALRCRAGTRGVFSHPRYLEVTAADVDKARRRAEPRARELGVPLAALAAIGDEENDIGMLREAGIGIAMGNAVAVRPRRGRPDHGDERARRRRARDRRAARRVTRGRVSVWRERRPSAHVKGGHRGEGPGWGGGGDRVRVAR